MQNRFTFWLNAKTSILTINSTGNQTCVDLFTQLGTWDICICWFKITSTYVYLLTQFDTRPVFTFASSKNRNSIYFLTQCKRLLLLDSRWQLHMSNFWNKWASDPCLPFNIKWKQELCLLLTQVENKQIITFLKCLETFYIRNLFFFCYRLALGYYLSHKT